MNRKYHALIAADSNKVAKLIRLILGAGTDGECLAAVEALKRMLKAAGTDSHELASTLTNGNKLSDWVDDEDWRTKRDFCL